MSAESLIFLIVSALSLIILKKSYDVGMFAKAIPPIAALYGAIYYGAAGLILGLIFGFMLIFALAGILLVLENYFDISFLLSRKKRRLIASKFIAMYKPEIIELENQHLLIAQLGEKLIMEKLFPERMNHSSGDKLKEYEQIYDEKKLIDSYSKYIIKIFQHERHLKDKTRRHKDDLETIAFKTNFVRAGEEWVKKTGLNSKEREIKSAFVKYCAYILYETDFIKTGKIA